MSDMVKDRKAGDIKSGSGLDQTGVRNEFQAAGTSFKGYSGQDKESAQWLQEQGKNLAAMGSAEPDSKNTDKEAAAIAAASLLPSYLASKTKDKILDKAEEKKEKNKARKERHQSRSDENKSESEQTDAHDHETVDPAKRKAMKERVKEQGRKQEKTQSRNHGTNMEGTSAGTSDFWKSERGCNDKGSFWAQEAVKQTNISREEMKRKCGINHPDDHEEHVKKPSEEANNYVTNDARGHEDEQEVCSREEREKSKEKKQAKEQKEKEKKKKSEKDKRSKRKEAARARRTKKMMIRRFIVQQGMDPENPNMESGIGGLAVQLIRHDISRLLGKIGKKVIKLLLIIFSAVLQLVLMVAAVILPILLIVIIVLHPVSFFLGIFDGQEEILNNPKYVKTVVETKYTDFYEEISDFANVAYTGGNKCNQVTYADGYRSNMGAVIAVYLSKICNDDDYSKLISEEQSDDIPYCLVDTAKEERILKEVFRQFNYWEKEAITVEVQYGVYDQETLQTTIVTEQVQAEKMTVHTLSLKKWKDIYLESMTREEKEMLRVLAEYADSFMNGTGNGDSDYGPITNIPIPEGADQNLIYMAAFIKAEAGGQPFQGKAAVGYVILNRAGGLGGNIIGVLTAPGQFSCYIPHHTVEPYIAEYARMSPEQRNGDECWLAAVGVYTNTLANPIGDIRYYCNPRGCSVGETAQWAKIRAKNGDGDIIVIGDHVFCRNCW